MKLLIFYMTLIIDIQVNINNIIFYINNNNHIVSYIKLILL